MKTKNKKAYFMCFATLLMLLAQPTMAANWVATDLGVLEIGGISEAKAINDAGQIVGTSPVNKRDHVFFWSETNGMNDIGTLVEDLSVWHPDINSSGQVTGTASVASEDGYQRAFLWDSTNGMINLGPVPGEDDSEGKYINNNGQIVGGYGSSRGGSGDLRAFFRDDDGVWTDLGTLGGGSLSVYDLNDNGQVVGGGSNSSYYYHAFLWETTVMQDLGTLGGDRSSAYAINEAGHIVGYSETEPDSYESRAFLWDGGMTALATLSGNSGATDINEFGQIVGNSKNSEGTYGTSRAVLWSGAGVQDLGTTPSDYHSNAIAINNKGQVIGYIRDPAHNDSRQSFVWTVAEGSVELLPLPGHAYSDVTAINEVGDIIGYSFNLEDPDYYYESRPCPVGTLDCRIADERATLWTLEGPPNNNTPPQIDDIVAPVDPVPVGMAVYASAGFTDPDDVDTHSATWNWGDGTVFDVEVDGRTVSADHIYEVAGVYTVTLTVTDAAGESDQAVYEYVVVYDPDAGFVTGGGWIDSPAGAYVPDPQLTGKASFGFVSKYKKGAIVPTGNTSFQFKTADLNFHSSSYEWLVVTGSNYAKFKGIGTINGQASYKFMLWAGDDAFDTFRIKIWTEDESGVETVVYDNGHDQDIGGGSIVIHD